MKKFLLALGAVCLVSSSALSVGALAQNAEPKTVTKTFVRAKLTSTQSLLHYNLRLLKKDLEKASTPEAKAKAQASIDEAISNAQANGMTIDEVNTVLANIQAEEAIATIQENTEVINLDGVETDTATTFTITFLDPQSGYTPGG
jgi:hypothetical protein